MKLILAILGFIILFGISCNDNNCDNAPTFEKCSETPDTGTTCTAYFNSWFYDEATGKCTQIGYSGCEAKGFETEEECKACDCYRLE